MMKISITTLMTYNCIGFKVHSLNSPVPYRSRTYTPLSVTPPFITRLK